MATKPMTTEEFFDKICGLSILKKMKGAAGSLAHSRP